MANDHFALYTGVSNNLSRRVYEHKNNFNINSFTAKYSIHKLVYYESLESIETAIIREKQIKDMNRDEKIRMIYKFNPIFKDLYEEISS